MHNQDDEETAFERIGTAIGLVAVTVVLFATAVNYGPLVYWAVS